MESDGEDLENIFEEYENTENDTGADKTENGQTTNETSTKIAAPKRIVKNPRLKFNPERLCGERGIPILMAHFKNAKFKGVGHEKEDLDKLLSKLEHWTHRLFPSMKFEDCLNHIEKLGKKRPVQTCLRKIRLDMPILNSDFVKDDEDDDVKRNDDPEPDQVDAFDRLIEESQNIMNPNVSNAENVPNSSYFYSSPVSNDTRGHVLGSSFVSSITEEQKERMEHNRMLAAERRKARLAFQQDSVDSQSANHEIAPSQNVSTVQNSFDKLFDSSFKNQENTQNTGDDSVMEISHDNSESEKYSLELNKENSENLGLDDLLDLVDKEEPVSNKNSPALSSEQLKAVFINVDKTDRFSVNGIEEINCSNFEQNDNVSVSNNADNEIALSLKASETANEESLGIESLLDLVNENSDYQQNSDPSCSVTDTSVCDTSQENSILDSKEQLTAMDYVGETSKNIETENYISVCILKVSFSDSCN